MRAAGMEDTAAVVERQLEAELAAMSLQDALSLARAFSHYLSLIGIAETHHRYSRRVLVHSYTHDMVSYDVDGTLHQTTNLN
jgi:phosphoenolpyruvate carboxylase